MGFQRIYKASDSQEAHFIAGLLKTYSIESQILGQNLAIGLGELPMEVAQVSIFVHKKDFNHAKKIIKQYEKELISNENSESWLCNVCNNKNPMSFEICWNCSNKN